MGKLEWSRGAAGWEGVEGPREPFSRRGYRVTSGPDFGEGDYSKTSHTQDELVLELSVDHLRTIGGVVWLWSSLKPVVPFLAHTP